VPKDDSAQSAENPLVLIANDQEWTARAIESILVDSGLRVLRSFTASETMRVAGEADPDLVILDNQLPDYSGIEVCRKLRADPRFGPGLPIIITTAGPSGRPQRIAAYDAGAWEFYGQPLDAEALLHKLHTFIASYRELRRIRGDALIDSDTGLYSRQGLVRRAGELLGDARRSSRAVACVRWTLPANLDADRLHRSALVFRAQGRTADAHGRLGDNEFATVAPDTGSKGADRLASRFRDLICEAGGMAADAVRVSVVAVDDTSGISTDGEQLLERLGAAVAA